ncbi:MAG: hypothetical protein JWM55_1875 [Acidimicrobiaceae bacterium]|nr:hypothetical protein [Acidimicrobiaceae bacterium]
MRSCRSMNFRRCVEICLDSAPNFTYTHCSAPPWLDAEAPATAEQNDATPRSPFWTNRDERRFAEASLPPQRESRE